jgi:large subunit ribosomal protein L24
MKRRNQKSRRKHGAHIRTQKRPVAGQLHVRKGDVVMILAGNDKGKTGEVKEAFPRLGRVLVQGINLRWRHKKPTQQSQTGKGERVQQESSIHASNVRFESAGTERKKSDKHRQVKSKTEAKSKSRKAAKA